MSPYIRVFLAEDHQMVRSAMAALIGLEEDIEVVGEAGRGDEALEAILALRPDVALLDIDMPGLDGLRVVERLATLAPECGTLVVTAIGKEGTVRNYTSNLQSKFGARNRVDLVRIAHDHGWL